MLTAILLLKLRPKNEKYGFRTAGGSSRIETEEHDSRSRTELEIKKYNWKVEK